ncbi:hypothetical protein C8D97_105108 [Pleionea mediterranea]|jgi:hypothetical protein|uniref:Uncharacterized protein n=1 Tax=Pleionea mediterranea TaxID=523701 RepID=A0A316FTV4_9GAMM|nr:hypothetical protein C8D97_105108 [Pleionea mediterranea]|tara:strand:- start:211 stop:333 length:123 start_codon:yes stop_codon:yes gene_type:complete
MYLSYEWFEILIYSAVGLATAAPILLIVLALIDWKKEQLW